MSHEQYSLKEYIDRLIPEHKARVEYETLKTGLASKTKFIGRLSHELELLHVSHSEESEYIDAIRKLMAQIKARRNFVEFKVRVKVELTYTMGKARIDPAEVIGIRQVEGDNTQIFLRGSGGMLVVAERIDEVTKKLGILG